ncbi:hypothetical protein RUND412_006246 [Rhizina undulata]
MFYERKLGVIFVHPPKKLAGVAPNIIHERPSRFRTSRTEFTEEERVLLRKIDLNVLPVLYILLLLTFIDRSNIGNARILGMEEELEMSGAQFNTATFVFFIPYIFFELPWNVYMRRVKPSTFLAAIMVFWGGATVMMGLTKSYAWLVTYRVLLGIGEAGFPAGTIYLVSTYYRRYELQQRVTIFLSASILAGALGGLLACAINKMDGIDGNSGWRWIFIIEGSATVIIGWLSQFFVPDWPEEARFLNPYERKLLLGRLHEDGGIAKMNRLDGESLGRIIGDWKIYCGALMYILVVETPYAASFFLPTILLELGYTAESAQIRTIPVYIVAAIISIFTATLTDKYRHRFLFALFGILLGTIGYLILLFGQSLSPGVKYFATFLVVSGGCTTQPITITWLANNMGGHYKKSFGSAIQIGFGNVAGIVAANVFLGSEAPEFRTGYATGLGMMLGCGVMCVVFWYGLRRENRKRAEGKRDYRFRGEMGNLGDDHPDFRFVL